VLSEDSGAWLAALARRHGLAGLLLEDDLALAGRSVDAHTTSRLLHAILGAGAGLLVWAVAGLLMPLPVFLLPALPVFAVIFAILIADRRVRDLAAARRQEAQLAVAAYVDLVAILLIGGLPLGAALRTGADQGSGWAFTQIRAALSWAGDRGQGPDAGLEHLAHRYPVPEFADLALSIASARRGASPVIALESKAAFMRGASAAQARAEAAVADAQIELPSAVVALAFIAFLTYPLMSLLTTTPGVTS
jgi:Flp pilus assembly protein TadB